MSTQAKAVDRLARKCRIKPQLVEDAYPCTGLQAALVAASLQGLGDYVSHFVFDVSSATIGAEALKAACETVYKQNAILRSRVIENGGQFLQVVTKESLHWLEADNLEDFLGQDRQLSVVLGQPLAKFAWVREGGGKTWMVWSLHHSQYDEWSFKMMVEDLNAVASQVDASTEIAQRPPFSKFIKALNKIDMSASHNFWKSKLQSLSQCRQICPRASPKGTCRTSQRIEKLYKLRIPSDCAYQPSLLSVAAWSLFISHLSSSTSVFFGHVLSGRTMGLEGIQDVCGPTLATVPWHNKLPYEESVRSYLDQLQELRLQILPFEQTGIDEYRKLAGTAAFDTLLSVRSSQGRDDKDASMLNIQPEKLDRVDLSHPCCIFLELDIEGDNCKLKASYDDHYIDAELLGYALDGFMSAVEALPLKFDATLETFIRSLELPPSIEIAEDSNTPQRKSLESSTDTSSSDIDAEMMQKIQQLACATMGTDNLAEIGPNTTLMQLGMDSLKTVVLSRQLSKAFHTSIPFTDITGPGRTLQSIGRSVERALRKTTHRTKSIPGDWLLDMAEGYMKAIRTESGNVSICNASAPSEAPSILLTGATGYLGIEILRQCLNAGCNKIIVLVRCETPSDGIERVLRTAKVAAWEPVEIKQLERVTVWPSDLAKKRLGLAAEHWQLLSSPDSSPTTFKAIIHNGAKVDFLHTYHDLEAANVNSTAILLEQLVKMAKKPNFVFVTGGRPCPVVPDELEETATKLAEAGGYAQTKFVSEVLMHRTKALYEDAGQTAHMSIVHPGAIIGSSRSGVANTDDYVWRYVAASASMGYYVPAVPTQREWINLTPVDSVASAIVSQALMTKEAAGFSSTAVVRYLIREGLSIGHFWLVVTQVLQESGVALEPTSEWEWLQELEADLDWRGQEQPLFSLSQLLLQGQLKGIGGRPPAIDARTGAGPETASVEAALRSNIRYLTSKSFFSPGTLSSDVFARSKV